MIALQVNNAGIGGIITDAEALRAGAGKV